MKKRKIPKPIKVIAFHAAAGTAYQVANSHIPEKIIKKAGKIALKPVKIAGKIVFKPVIKAGEIASKPIKKTGEKVEEKFWDSACPNSAYVPNEPISVTENVNAFPKKQKQPVPKYFCLFEDSPFDHCLLVSVNNTGIQLTDRTQNVLFYIQKTSSNYVVYDDLKRVQGIIEVSQTKKEGLNIYSRYVEVKIAGKGVGMLKISKNAETGFSTVLLRTKGREYNVTSSDKWNFNDNYLFSSDKLLSEGNYLMEFNNNCISEAPEAFMLYSAIHIAKSLI